MFLTVPYKALADVVSGEGQLPGCQAAGFLTCPHSGRGARHLSGTLL